jgi:phosphatidylglycerophosphate synthase
VRRLLPPLDLEAPGRVHRYRFDFEDRSLLQPVFDRLIIRPLLARLPAGLAPNALTLLGHAAWQLVFLWLVLAQSPGAGRTAAGAGAAWLAVIALALHALTDSLDGQQARAHGTATPLGDFYDHWLDALTGVTVPLAILVFCGPAPTLAVVVLTLNALAWHANTLERLAEGRLMIPPVGALEGAAMALVLMLATGLAGPAFWTAALFGFGTLEIAAGLAGLAYLATAVSGYRRHRSLFAHPGRGLVLDLALLAGMAFVLPVDGVDGFLLALAIGLLGVRHVGHVLMHILIGLRLKPIAWPLTLFLAAVTASLHAGAAPRLVLALVIAVLALTLLIQFVTMTRYCCRELGIEVWTVRRQGGAASR